jgi:hypothetical protein
MAKTHSRGELILEHNHSYQNARARGLRDRVECPNQRMLRLRRLSVGALGTLCRIARQQDGGAQQKTTAAAWTG